MSEIIKKLSLKKAKDCEVQGEISLKATFQNKSPRNMHFSTKMHSQKQSTSRKQIKTFNLSKIFRPPSEQRSNSNSNSNYSK